MGKTFRRNNKFRSKEHRKTFHKNYHPNKKIKHFKKNIKSSPDFNEEL
jgi:hypothetical protein